MRCRIDTRLKQEHVDTIQYLGENNYLNRTMKEILNFKKEDSYYSEEDVYNFIFPIFLKSKINELYVLNVNLDFESSLFLEHLTTISEIVRIKIFEYVDKYIVRIVKLINLRTILIVENFDLFDRIYNRDIDILNKIKNILNITNFVTVLLCRGNGYEIINKLHNREKVKENLIFRDCFEKFIICKIIADYDDRVKFLLTEVIYIKLQYRYNINFDNIYTICKNRNDKKLNINFYNISNIEEFLTSKLFNQNEAIDSVLYRMERIKNMQVDYDKPLGSWLLCGPSGSGKTELAKILTYSIFNSEDKLIKINMTEYMEEHAVSKLIGSPPGYLGYGSNTILANKFKSGSSFVILFDEIEKAHKNVIDLMLQILDTGKLTLSNNDIINFNNSFIVFTSNIGYTNKLKGKNKIDKNYIDEEIRKFFRPEFLNRLNDIIIFNTMDNYIDFNRVLNKFINSTCSKYHFRIKIKNDLRYDVINSLYNPLYGSRPLRRFNEYVFDTLIFYNNVFQKNKNYNLYYLHNLESIKICNKVNPIS